MRKKKEFVQNKIYDCNENRSSENKNSSNGTNTNSMILSRPLNLEEFMSRFRQIFFNTVHRKKRGLANPARRGDSMQGKREPEELMR